MPELPEVETVCRGLAKALTGARVTAVDAHRPDLRQPLPRDLGKRLKGQRVLDVHRRAKYILMSLDGGDTLLLHLGMSGRMVITHAAAERQKHDHLVFAFDNGMYVSFNDPRRFGLCDITKTADLNSHKFLGHLGIEPLEKDLTPKSLAKAFLGKKTSIKVALLDQRIVVGIGNIYACEALFYAGISPLRLANSCKPAEIAKLVPAIRKVLDASIKAGGSSLRDYVQADGGLGFFQNDFAVYDREGQPCPGCTCNPSKTGGVLRVAQGGRSSFYCPRKQG